MSDVEILVEQRNTSVAAELRASGDRKRIAGYAALFHTQSRNLGGFIEEIAPDAFNTPRLRNWEGVVARFNHDDSMLLGTVAGGTLKLSVDGAGLAYDVLPPEARRDIVELVERGDVRSSSFAFRCLPGGDEWTTTDTVYPKRVLTGVELIDVAPVTTPAYEDTTAGLRSLARHFDASFEEVRSLAEREELRKFFVRTDGPGPAKPKPLFGPLAAAQLLARRQDPWA